MTTIALIGFLLYWLPWPLQRTMRRAVGFGLLGAVIVFLERWLILPADTPWNLALGLALNALLAALISNLPFEMVEKKAHINRAEVRALTVKVGTGLLILIATWTVSSPIFHASSYQQTGQIKALPAAPNVFDEIDIHSLVLVPEETARNKAMQVVGAHGSQFSLGEFYLQRVNGQLVWISPLEFAGLFAQFSAKVSPGYVSISATDPLAGAKLVDGQQFRYMEDGFFGQSVYRHVRSLYPEKILMEASLEVDDAGKAYQAVSAGHYTVGRGAAVVDGVILVDAASGESQYYALADVPAWVDQVVPANVAAEYITWWGKYSSGWLNSLFGKRDVKIPTEVTSGARIMAGVNGPDGQFYWFTGLTSPNPQDNSLIGVALVNARSGEAEFVPVASVASEEYVVSAVESRYKAERYGSGYPLPYTIYGQFTYVAPVVDTNNGQWQAVAFVSGDGSRMGVGRDLDEALRQYKSELGRRVGTAPGDQAKMAQISGTIERIAPVTERESVVYYVVLKEAPKKVFLAPIGLSPYLPVSQPGDPVRMQYAETGETLVPATSFSNPALE